jgi:hypothetical protein
VEAEALFPALQGDGRAFAIASTVSDGKASEVVNAAAHGNFGLCWLPTVPAVVPGALARAQLHV